MTHTQRPWKQAGTFASHVILSDGSVIDCPHKDADTAIANARLIAAAPELLEACRQAQTWLSCSSDDGDLEMYNLLDAAITKAEPLKSR